MNRAIEDESLNIEEVKKKTDAMQTKIKFQAFGKTKPPTGRTQKRRLEGGQGSAQGMDGEKKKRKSFSNNLKP